MNNSPLHTFVHNAACLLELCGVTEVSYNVMKQICFMTPNNMLDYIIKDNLQPVL